MSEMAERVARAMYDDDSRDVTPAFRVTWEGSLDIVSELIAALKAGGEE